MLTKPLIILVWLMTPTLSMLPSSMLCSPWPCSWGLGRAAAELRVMATTRLSLHMRDIVICQQLTIILSVAKRFKDLGQYCTSPFESVKGQLGKNIFVLFKYSLIFRLTRKMTTSYEIKDWDDPSSCVWAVEEFGSNWQHWCHQQSWWQARWRWEQRGWAERANSTDQSPASLTPPLLVWNHFRTFKIQFSLSQNQWFKQL